MESNRGSVLSLPYLKKGERRSCVFQVAVSSTRHPTLGWAISCLGGPSRGQAGFGLVLDRVSLSFGLGSYLREKYPQNIYFIKT